MPPAPRNCRIHQAALTRSLDTTDLVAFAGVELSHRSLLQDYKSLANQLLGYLQKNDQDDAAKIIQQVLTLPFSLPEPLKMHVLHGFTGLDNWHR